MIVLLPQSVKNSRDLWLQAEDGNGKLWGLVSQYLYIPGNTWIKGYGFDLLQLEGVIG